ncbi:MAG: hypothetical protein MUF67_03380 [Desulfobacterales bacterium]|jgi:hypothetical protein|nr:hypothetical protein [Desulfobacterales bacterium]MDZ7597474.1 hypothetical protein [Desulfobacterales bacterium]
MNRKPTRYPPCFGDLKTVFPMGQDGLRHTPRQCMICVFKTECLRSAMDGADGLGVREESVDRAYAAGMIGFFQRWSRKKDLRRRREADSKDPEGSDGA